MCGWVAQLNSLSGLHERLEKLSYRGMDSWGFGSWYDGAFFLAKGLGKLPKSQPPLEGTHGLGHVRWSTTGPVSLPNAHPITGGKWEDELIVVHNGIIVNHRELREELLQDGYTFYGETDTEVLAHYLVRSLWSLDRVDAIRNVLQNLHGQYTFAVITQWGEVIVASCGVSVYINDTQAASDPSALSPGKCLMIRDGFIILGENKPYGFHRADDDVVTRHLDVVADSRVKKLQGVMWSEIQEQPEILRRGPRVSMPNHLGGQVVHMFGCGSSLNAAYLAQRYFRHFSVCDSVVSHSCDVDPYSFTSYPVVPIAVTQSGETRDTLNAMDRFAYNPRAIAVTNVIYSEAFRNASYTIDINCGPEVAVAATKTFTGTVAAFLHLIFQWTNKHPRHGWNLAVADSVEAVLKLTAEIDFLAKFVTDFEHVLILGRGWDYPVALEGALKLKEVAYIHAEAVHAAEMKHGPIALIDDDTLSLFLISDHEEFDRVRLNMEEIQARYGQVAVICDEGIEVDADFVLRLPFGALESCLRPFPVVVALQMLALKLAEIRGHDPDCSRHLAKCATVT